MNSKQRVNAVLKGGRADKIPYGELAIDSDTVERIIGHETYLRAKMKTRIALWEGRRDEVVQSYKEDMVQLYDKLDICDIVNLMSEACGLVPPKDYIPSKPKQIDEKTWEDKDGKIYKYSEATRDIIMVHDPLLWDREYNEEDFDINETLVPPDESQFEAIDYVANHFKDSRFVVSFAGREAGMLLPGNMERGLSEYITNPEGMQALIDCETRWGNYEDEFFIRKGVDAIMWGQDFAYNAGPLISPSLFRKMILPSIQSRVANVKNNFNIPVIKHCCGNTLDLSEMFMEAGYDCYQSLQKSAGMHVPKLRENYGSKMCLWGGIDVATLLAGTKEDIIAETKEAIEFAKEGGMILGSSHSIATGCKYDNFMVMLDVINNER